MICRMRTSIASVDGWSYKTGQEVHAGAAFGKDEVPAETLRGWVIASIAEPIPERRTEAAVSLETETAAVSVPRRRHKGR